jgi:hypothetical protein
MRENTMKFYNEGDREKFKMLYGLSLSEDGDEKPYLNVMQKRNDQIRDILSYRKSKAAELGWQKFRNNYKIGMDRYYKSPHGQNTYKRIVRGLRGGLAAGLFDINDKEGRYECLSEIAQLKAGIYDGLNFFMMEDEAAEYQLFVEACHEALTEIEKSLIFETGVSDAALECLLCLVQKEVFSETTLQAASEEEPLLEIFRRKTGRKGADISS